VTLDFTITKEDWSLYRKGELDRARHQEKVREAIRQNLGDLVTEESILLPQGEKVIKIPLRSLREYHFRFDLEKGRQVGQGRGQTQVGDVLGPVGSAEGGGSGAGDQPGSDYYEAEITLAEVEELLFEELALPNLEEKKSVETAEGVEFREIRKNGLWSNIDKKRTLLALLKRRALQGQPGFGPPKPDDLRFKTWDLRLTKHSNAVILAMMDTSGSMGTFEKYLARGFYFWLLRFLRSKYEQVLVRFLAHHTEAQEVGEREFFTKGESGGTRISSVYQLALEIIARDYPSTAYNIYPFHFSDGDNLPSDNQEAARLARELAGVSNLFGYGEIASKGNGSTLYDLLGELEESRFRRFLLREKGDIYGALRWFFGQAGSPAGGLR